ncbi:MAG: DNA polymerase A family protein, partial [candidate division WOR-3 bacterium]
IQQIPKESIIRSFFIPKLDWIVEADYSQLELRVAALLSGDTRLIEAYRKGEDLHYKTASLIFGKPIEEISNEERAVAKAINFGVLYGIGAKGLKETLAELGMEISEQKAEEFIKKFFLSYPELSTWVTDQKSKVKNQGYVQTLFGRKRRLPNDDEESVRQGVNAPVQGTGSDLTQFALLQIHAALKARKLKSHIIATVHDSIILDVADDELFEVLVIIKEKAEAGVMDVIRQKVPDLKEENLVPLKMDISIGKSWGEVEELDDF